MAHEELWGIQIIGKRNLSSKQKDLATHAFTALFLEPRHAEDCLSHCIKEIATQVGGTERSITLTQMTTALAEKVPSWDLESSRFGQDFAIFSRSLSDILVYASEAG